MHTRKSKPWMSMRCFDGDQIRQRTMTLCPKEQPRRLFSCSRRNCEDGVHQEKQGHSIVECSKESWMSSFASACFNAIGGYNPGRFLRMWKETLKYASGAKIVLLVPSQEHTAFERKGEGQDGSTACEARILHRALQSCKPGQHLTDIFGPATISRHSPATNDMECLMIGSAEEEASSPCLLIPLVYLKRSEAMAVRCFRAKSSAEGQVCNSTVFWLATPPCQVKAVCVVTVENILLTDIVCRKFPCKFLYSLKCWNSRPVYQKHSCFPWG